MGESACATVTSTSYAATTSGSSAWASTAWISDRTDYMSEPWIAPWAAVGPGAADNRPGGRVPIELSPPPRFRDPLPPVPPARRDDGYLVDRGGERVIDLN